MMMPGVPAAHWIVSHAAFAVRLAKAVLDEAALCLHPSQRLPRRIQRRIG